MKYRQSSRYKTTRKQKHPETIQADLCSKDFYTCVNTQWLRHVHMPPYLAAFGISEEVEKRIEAQLFSIAYSCMNAYHQKQTTNTEETMMGAVVHSVLHVASQQNSVASLQEMLDAIQCLKTKEDIARSIGQMCRSKISTLLGLEGKYFDKHRKEFSLFLARGSIGLPDKLYYEDESPGRWKTLHYYTEFLEKLGRAFHIPDLVSVIETEKKLAPYILLKRVKEEESKLYGHQLQSLYTHIPWAMIFEGYGVSGWSRRVFAVESREWLSILNTLFQNESIEFWKLLLKWETLHHFVAYLPPPFDDYHFEFFRKRLRGQAQKLPQKYLMLDILGEWLNPFLSKEYSKRFISSEFKKKAEAFAKEIHQATLHRIHTVDWLQPHTRSLAIEKVKQMRLSIACPDSKVSLPLPKVVADNLVKNLLSLGEWSTDQILSKLGQLRSAEKGWEDPVFAVNAYFYAENNELILPYGSLFDPFYSETRPLGWNYGGVGAILGHEITHAFDEDGKEYDPYGYKKHWWSSQDTKKYQTIIKKIISLFNKQKVLGHSVDGVSTASENIADLGGLGIALDALNKRLDQEHVSLEERKKAYQNFFISYAMSWRVKERPQKQLQALLVDRHAPAHLRVNLVVNQFQEWYDAFNIQKGDPLYIAPEDRIRIF